jgi:hypothetical protein
MNFGKTGNIIFLNLTKKKKIMDKHVGLHLAYSPDLFFFFLSFDILKIY